VRGLAFGDPEEPGLTLGQQHEVRAVEHLADLLTRPGVGQRRLLPEPRDQLDVDGSRRADRAHLLGDAAVEQRDEARHAAFHQLLVDDVGGVEAGLGPGRGRVLDLHDQQRTLDEVLVGRQARERRDLGIELGPGVLLRLGLLRLGLAPGAGGEQQRDGEQGGEGTDHVTAPGPVTRE
jgi:hypothetical protein